MDKTLFDQLVQLLLPDMRDPDNRRALIESALYGSPVLGRIDWRGAAHPFTVQIVRELEAYGRMGEKAALALLLEGLREQVGEDRQAQIDALLPQLNTAQPSLKPPEVTIEEALYVFLSYARPQQAVAEQIEAYLRAAGVHVFRDTSEIREGANWDMAIEQALRECQRMVLLLSSASMPYRKEVHREWFYFDQKRKPIYPLYLEDCDLHSRIYAYNYLDARADLQGALERLLKALGRDYTLPDAATGADKVGVFANALVEPRTLPEALQALLEAVRDPEGGVVLSEEQAKAIVAHKPLDLTEYRLGRIAEWSLPRYALDNRFVNLTLLLDKGEHEPLRWQPVESMRFHDLGEVLRQRPDDRVLVLLGQPGSGKSTLLRRLQLDHSIEQLREAGEQVSFFAPLNSYRARADGVLPEPRQWLEMRWADDYPHLPPLADLLREGRLLLLLDALNEMPHKGKDEYPERVGLWRDFAQAAARAGNRVLFSCRSLDYSASLSSPDLRVPQVDVQPMSTEQVQDFLKAYAPAHATMIWRDLDGAPQFSLFQSPYFLKLLCEQVTAARELPKGRAGLFTGFVRRALTREVRSGHRLFQPDSLLTERDHRRIVQNQWRDAFDLPERSLLIPSLCGLAYAMQQEGLESEGAQVRILYEVACRLLPGERDEDTLKAGVALNVLDEDVAQDEILFFHQLLQEYFAARKLAQEPNPALVHVAWHVDQVSPTLEDTVAGLADGDPLPPLPQTGWEETTLTAAPMTRNPNAFIRDLMAHNLPLAARCAASPEVKLDPDLKREIQHALIARSQDFQKADLRARIAAGEALGLLGDPRFERKTGPQGDYLLPPLVTIPAGTYPIGDDEGQYDDEKPAHTVELGAFQIGQFPVTNAEYTLFIEAGGYEDERWWDSDEALAWLRGEGSTEGQKLRERELRQTLQGITEEQIRDLVPERITSKQADDFITIRNWPDERFEAWLDATYPSGQIYRQPEYWDDTRFNSPLLPVVGITWFEARAYCNWLSANALTPGPSPEERGEKIYTLPTEAQFEAAARGTAGREYPYGSPFDSTRCNTFESHIRRTTPVGIFDNATPEGAFDLTGNAYTWTGTLLRDYPYDPVDGREATANPPDARRVLRGGSWVSPHSDARCAYRSSNLPYYRNFNLGFRLVCVRAPSL